MVSTVDNRSKESANSNINHFTGVGKLCRKITHPHGLRYESYNARPVYCVCKAPPGWSGVKKSSNRGGSGYSRALHQIRGVVQSIYSPWEAQVRGQVSADRKITQNDEAP